VDDGRDMGDGGNDDVVGGIAHAERIRGCELPGISGHLWTFLVCSLYGLEMKQ
jgi:hypothetical protein